MDKDGSGARGGGGGGLERGGSNYTFSCLSRKERKYFLNDTTWRGMHSNRGDEGRDRHDLRVGPRVTYV